MSTQTTLDTTTSTGDERRDQGAIATPSHASQHVISPASTVYILETTDSAARTPLDDSLPLTRCEAEMIHHYTTHLSRWLDCTDATRQFTVRLPRLVRDPIIRHAIISLTARHRGDTILAEDAHARCIELLIPLLGFDNVVEDGTVLCAIVVLRVYEQLSGTCLLPTR